jgi:DAACS family dicarboxylate/amino acid:cation (Na+ or H+) symporter
MQPFEQEVVSDLDEQTDDRAEASRRVPLHVRILLGLVIGAVLGSMGRALLGPDSPLLSWIIANVAEPVGQLFLRSLLMTVVPLVASSLIVGVAGIGDVRRLGRLGLRTIGFCLVISLVSVALGIFLANTVRPGLRIDPATRDLLMAEYADQSKQVSPAASNESPVMSFVRTLVPANPLESMARSTPDMIGIMFFSIVFGAALTLISPESAAPVITLLDGVFKVVAKIIDMVMKVAPIGVACLLFAMTARFGFGFLASLGWYVVTVLGGLAIHTFVVYAIALKFWARVSPVSFSDGALSCHGVSTSSPFTPPTALRVSETNLGCHARLAHSAWLARRPTRTGPRLRRGDGALPGAAGGRGPHAGATVDDRLSRRARQHRDRRRPRGIVALCRCGARHGRDPHAAHRDHHRRRSTVGHEPDSGERAGRSDGDRLRGQERGSDAHI